MFDYAHLSTNANKASANRKKQSIRNGIWVTLALVFVIHVHTQKAFSGLIRSMFGQTLFAGLANERFVWQTPFSMEMSDHLVTALG